jgi:hypothetical protein
VRRGGSGDWSNIEGYMWFGVGFLLLFCFPGFGMIAECQDTLDLNPGQKGTLICWTETRTAPRRLKIYCIRVDLTCRNLEVFTLTGEDPDGEGPAESSLTLPSEMFSTFHALAAINANAFAGLPGTEKDIRGWYRNRPVDIQGMAVRNGKVISPPQRGRTAFWLDSLQQPHIGDPNPADPVWQASSDWSSPLILENRIIPDSTGTALHPRTALGFDDSGKWLLLMVVDGRQPGFSEGISLYELALLFKSFGCTQSINLDGGGSSIMIIQKPDGEVQTINSPSGLVHRPVPVMLGVKNRRDA